MNLTRWIGKFLRGVLRRRLLGDPGWIWKPKRQFSWERREQVNLILFGFPCDRIDVQIGRLLVFWVEIRK